MDSSARARVSGDAELETQIDIELELGVTYPEEQPYREVVGEFVQNDFSEIRKNLAALKLAEMAVAPVNEEKKPELVAPKARAQKKAPKRVARAKPAAAEALPTSEPPVPQVLELIPPPATVVAQTPAQALPQPRRAQPENIPVVTQSPVLDASADLGEVYGPPAPVPMRVELPVPVPVVEESMQAPADTFDTDLHIRLAAPDRKLRKFLRENGAHLELYLQPIGKRTGTHPLIAEQDIDLGSLEAVSEVRTYHEYAAALSGRYRLVAGIYRAHDKEQPYKQIFYPEEINRQTARRQVVFVPRFGDLRAVTGRTGEGTTSLVLSLFQGGSPDFDQARVLQENSDLAGARARLIGFPERELYTANAKGNIFIPDLAPHSQYIVEIRAKDHYRTYQAIPVYGTDSYQHVFLVSKKQAANLATLSGAQQFGGSVLMGRVFDPVTRFPKEDVRVDLVGHNPALTYFKLFQADPREPRTSSLGFFDFFGIESFTPVRHVFRPDQDARIFETLIEPGSGYYVELGRAGQHSFKGRLYDPNRGAVVGARVRLAGDTEFEDSTDVDGAFEIPGVDFPAGVISLEVDAPGYRPSRHMAAWNPLRANQTQTFFQVQDHFVEESLALSRLTSFGPNPRYLAEKRGTGNLIAGAYGGLFKGLGAEDCLRAELWSVETARVVDAGHGPFAFLSETQAPVCLRPEAPGVSFTELPEGRYLLKWTDDAGQMRGSRVIHISSGFDTLAVN